MTEVPTSRCGEIDLAAVIAALQVAGYGDDIEWSENLLPPTDPATFAMEIAFVICNSGMRFKVARAIFEKVRGCLLNEIPIRSVFNHHGKASAIEAIWAKRSELLAGYTSAGDKLAYLEALPWIGPTTKYHLAKNFGLQYAKPDVHMQRLATALETTPQQLCEDLAVAYGLKVATVDTLLWRAAAIGRLDTSTGRVFNDE